MIYYHLNLIVGECPARPADGPLRHRRRRRRSCSAAPEPSVNFGAGTTPFLSKRTAMRWEVRDYRFDSGPESAAAPTKHRVLARHRVALSRRFSHEGSSHPPLGSMPRRAARRRRRPAVRVAAGSGGRPSGWRRDGARTRRVGRAASHGSPDAALVYVENDEDVDPAGSAPRWGYLFYSPSRVKARAYSIRDQKIVVAEDLDDQAPAAARDRGLDRQRRGAALGELAGGQAYCRDHQGRLGTMLLLRGAFVGPGRRSHHLDASSTPRRPRRRCSWWSTRSLALCSGRGGMMTTTAPRSRLPRPAVLVCDARAVVHHPDRRAGDRRRRADRRSGSAGNAGQGRTGREPKQPSHPTLRFLKENRDFIRGLYDQLSQVLIARAARLTRSTRASSSTTGCSARSRSTQDSLLAADQAAERRRAVRERFRSHPARVPARRDGPRAGRAAVRLATRCSATRRPPGARRCRCCSPGPPRSRCPEIVLAFDERLEALGAALGRAAARAPWAAGSSSCSTVWSSRARR